MPQQTTIQIVQETSYWWIPIVVVTISTIGLIIVACIKEIRKQKRSK